MLLTTSIAKLFAKRKLLDNYSVVDYRNNYWADVFWMKTGTEVSTVKALIAIVSCSAVGIACLVSTMLLPQIEMVLENLKGFLLELMVVSVALNESFVSSGQLKNLFEYMNRCWTQQRYDFSEEQAIKVKTSIRAKNNISMLEIFFVVNFPIMMLTKPVMEAIEGNSWKQLPFPWAISDNDAVFYTCFLFQTGAIMFSHFLGFVGICSLTIATNMSSLFNVLIMSIDHIEERAAKTREQQDLTYQESMLVCIQENMAHYRELVVEVLSEKPHLEKTFFPQIVTISMIMACEACPLLKEDVTMANALRGVVFLAMQVLCTALVCNRLEILSDKNTEVGRALYGTPWYKCDAQYRKIILNGMTFSQNPITVKGIYFFGLQATRATFYSAMVNTYNILNMIRKMG